MDPITAIGLAAGAASLIGQERANRTSVNLANTQYQRAVADMRKAGINPMLAARIGGSAVPPISNVMDGVTSSAKEVALSSAEKRLISEQAEATRYSGLSALKQAELAQQNLVQQRERFEEFERRLWNAEIEQIKQNTATAKALENVNLNEAALRALQLPGAINEANMQRTWWGRMQPYITSSARAAGSFGMGAAMGRFLSRGGRR